MFGKTMGIIGLGNIGKRLAELLKVFDVKILTYNRTPKKLPHIQDVELEYLLKNSDVVCVTCKLTSETRGLIGKQELELMKSDAILTSTTGGVVNLNDLDDFLDKNSLFGVGLDDVDQQQVPKNLLKQENLVCTYHRAYDTNESENNRINLCIDNIEAFLKGKPINKI